MLLVIYRNKHDFLGMNIETKDEKVYNIHMLQQTDDALEWG